VYGNGYGIYSFVLFLSLWSLSTQERISQAVHHFSHYCYMRFAAKQERTKFSYFSRKFGGTSACHTERDESSQQQQCVSSSLRPPLLHNAFAQIWINWASAQRTFSSERRRWWTAIHLLPTHTVPRPCEKFMSCHRRFPDVEISAARTAGDRAVWRSRAHWCCRSDFCLSKQTHTQNTCRALSRADEHPLISIFVW